MSSPRQPDRVLFSKDIYQVTAGARAGNSWSFEGADVECRAENDVLAVDVRAPEAGVTRVVLRWDEPFSAGTRFLGDHWERGYGDLEWRSLVTERVMPWYFLQHAKGQTQGYGVRTGANALCFWTADARGFSLWIDLRSGTVPVRLGQRTLRAAEVVTGQWSESPFEAARAFCRLLCPQPRLHPTPVYGGNDWYYAYGHSTQETLLRDSTLISNLAGAAKNRPFSVVDGGWQYCGDCFGSPWHLANYRFPNIAKLAGDIRETGCHPGIWIRPLLTHEDLPATWTLPNRGNMPTHGRILDPSVPEVLEKIHADVRRLSDWGYELIKHDFSTYDLFAKWGFEMGGAITAGLWKFTDDSRTSAEIIGGLYRTVRDAAKDAVIIGCNTIGHLGAGLFQLQRTGDDTSGRNWERTRRMGINTLAFRMMQHETFFASDADCVGLTGAVPWELNRQWLSLLASSGTPLFVSASPQAVGPEQKAALQEAFAVASQPQAPAEPLDWMENTCPERWKIAGKEVTFDWSASGVPSPFIMA